MKNIYIPPTVEQYQQDIQDRAFPDSRFMENDYYRRLIGWVNDNRTPLLYNQDHTDEYANLSINFNWLLQRDYSQTKLGRPETILTMYALHEYTHMTNWLPTRLNEITANEYADQFTRSEYRASNETEILVHYRMPELRESVFPDMKIAVDLMKERGVTQPTSAILGKIRPLLVEHDEMDYLLGNDPEVTEALQRLKQFNGNRRWSAEHFEQIQQFFVDETLPQGNGLTDTEYEDVIATYEPSLTQENYERNVSRNVRMAFGMCGLAIPELHGDIGEAIQAAKELEGRHALIIRN
jgi:hypothetical protein